MTNPNDPAFIDAIGEGFKSGLTKREYFAAMAMQGFLQGTHWAALFPEGHYNWKGISKFSKAMADALIAELSK